MTRIWSSMYLQMPQLLQWRHDERDGVSNHRLLDCLLNCLLGAEQRKRQSSVSLAFVRGTYRWPMDSPHKGPVKRKMFSFDDVIMHLVARGPFSTQKLGDLQTRMSSGDIIQNGWRDLAAPRESMSTQSVLHQRCCNVMTQSPSHHHTNCVFAGVVLSVRASGVIQYKGAILPVYEIPLCRLDDLATVLSPQWASLCW